MFCTPYGQVRKQEMPMPDKPVLSLDKSERDLAARLLASFFDDYEHSIPGRRILPAIDRAALESLLTTPFPDKGIGVEGVFREINEKILPNSTTVSHPRFLAYVIGPPNGIAPYAEAIAAAINDRACRRRMAGRTVRL
jgi:aromatic-L-amino-acid decarboxylase